MVKEADIKLIDGYLQLISNRNHISKEELLNEVVAYNKTHKPSGNGIANSFGAWKSDETAEEIIAMIKESSHIKTERESLD